MASSSDVIYLSYLCERGFLFSPKDYMKIRTQHRIIGSFFGTDSSKGLTPCSRVLPAVFNKLETQLLTEKQIVKLIQKSQLKKPLSNSAIKDYAVIIENRIKHCKLLSQVNRANAVKQTTASINQELLQPIKKYKFDGDTFEAKKTFFDIPLSFPLRHEAEIVNLNITEFFMYRVYKDLWEKKKFLTAGESFGVDLIAYPGDPILFHASHTINITESHKVKPQELISKGRLAVNVNKLCVFAYPNHCNDIRYQTLEWENYKHKKS